MQARNDATDAPPRRAIVFDLGGVVVDWNPRNLYRRLIDDPREVERFLDEIGFHEWNLEQDRGRSFEEGVRVLSSRFPHRAQLIRAYHERWDESISGPIPGTLEIIEDLRAAGYPLHALTNWSAEKFGAALERFPFRAWFGTVVVSGEEGVCKPEPALFEILLERVGRRAEECVFIDDALVNVRAAAALGFQAIHFVSPVELRRELGRLGIPGER